nr:replication protein A 70 kDa DNA-binding subunit B-like [Ipomoea batatas]
MLSVVHPNNMQKYDCCIASSFLTMSPAAYWNYHFYHFELRCDDYLHSMSSGQFILASELRSPCNNKAIRVRTVRTYATYENRENKVDLKRWRCSKNLETEVHIPDQNEEDWFGLDDFADFEMIGFNDGGSSGSVRVTL